MRTDNLLESLRELKLLGMANALELQENTPDTHAMAFKERLGLIIDQEKTHRSDRRLKSRLRVAKLKEPAARIEELSFAQGRGLDKSQILSFANCDWLQKRSNILIVGPTGTGKTFLSCALAHRACLDGYPCRYYRMNQLLNDIIIAKADGSYRKLMSTFAKTDLLILDDWGLQPLNDEQRQSLFDLVDERHKIRSLIITSQLPIKNWYEQIADPTIADAIMDRMLSTSYKLNLKGKSMRANETELT